MLTTLQKFCSKILGVVHSIFDVPLIEIIYGIYVKWLRLILRFPAVKHTIFKSSSTTHYRSVDIVEYICASTHGVMHVTRNTEV